jgi:hypothetical protein
LVYAEASSVRRVLLTNWATGINNQRTSNNTGEYEFTGVLPGDYELQVSATGFKTEKMRLSVTVGARQRADIRLQIGSTQTVSISGEASRLETT